MMNIFLYLFSIIPFIFFFWFALLSIFEKEIQASIRSFALAIIVPVILQAFAYIDIPLVNYIMVCLIFLVILVLGLSFIPIQKHDRQTENSDFRIDERDTMFSRKEITQSPEKSATYYKANPHNLRLDKVWQQKPGLMNPASSMYHPLAFAAADASFFVIEELKQSVQPEPAKTQIQKSNQEFTSFIKTWSKKLGAVDVGICKLKPQHLYSYRGRGKVYGELVQNNHKYAIALTVEMDKDYLATGPSAPTLMESAQQYLNSGSIALQLTKFIANLGYNARAHIDGNYEVVCPLVARDAGLGEIGRMGLLMTPNLGPRVRIAVVTTDIPLLVDERSYDHSVHDFCQICKKCADVCPGKAIPFEPKKEIHGIKRWQINQERCFTYWCTSGTDCGRCMSVCPYSHPDNLLHNMVRWGIKHSWLFRYFALWMDDFFYGRKPKPKNQSPVNS
ncbi:reductive dehalogenase [Labilibacter sediminis]|nr:reductive dehalogenase [Labilibacter sediminis]